MLLTKLIFIFYLGYSFVQAQGIDIGWHVFALLVYFSLNLILYIFKKQTYKTVVLLVSVVLILYLQAALDQTFILLLPICLYELYSPLAKSRPIVLLLALLPLLFISEDLIALYTFSALLSFLLFQLADRFYKRSGEYVRQMDQMRRDMQRLTRHLNENEAYIKQSEYTLKLEERTRLSQEIHDSIGHSMTGALIQMEAAKSVMAADKDKAGELLQNAIHISKDGIERIRLTLKNMKPHTEEVGIHRLKLLMDEFSSQHSIPAPLTHHGDIDKISPLQWKVLVENTGEALTNLLKYSEATKVSIDLKVFEKFIRLEIKDNGRGAEKIEKGLGIAGMEERTASLNGTLIVDGSDGFSVTTLLPVRS